MGQGYFDDGSIAIELGEHVFATPLAVRRNVLLTPHGEPATLFDSGGGVMDVRVTGQRLRANLGDAERYAYERLRALACSEPGTVAFEDNRAKRVTFGDSVCVDGLAEVQAYRFVELSLQFRSPEKSTEPWPAFPAAAAPGTYAGTDTLLDYAAGGVTLGHHAEGMRIEMQRDYPLREIPRARGARARGPARGATIRFVVRSHAAVTGQNLARYLEDLERQIGPLAVDLTGNGNTFVGVVLESVRPVHTDRKHTAFEAAFAMEADCAEWTTTEAPLPTTTAGATETTAPGGTTTSTTTTTTVASTTTKVVGTTTTEAPFTGSTTTAGAGTTTTPTAVASTTTGVASTTTTPPLGGGSTTTEPGTTSTAPGTTTTEAGCEPPLKADYRMLACQVGSSFAPMNLVHWLDWVGDCRWEQTYAGLDLALEWDGANGRWEIHYTVAPNCWLVAWGPSTPCDPTGQYEVQECQDGGCFDGNACEENGAESQIWIFGPDDGDEIPGCICRQACDPYCCSKLYVDLPEYPCPPPEGRKCVEGTAEFERMEEECIWQPAANPTNWTLSPIHCVGEGVWQFTVYCGTCGCLNCVYELAAHTPACPEGTFALLSGPGCCEDHVGESLALYADTCGPRGEYCRDMCDECYEAWWPGLCGSEAGWIRWSNGRDACLWFNVEAPDGLTVSKLDCTYDEGNHQAYWYFTVEGDGIDCTFKLPMARNCSDCPDGRYVAAEVGACCGPWLDVYRCGQAPGPAGTTTSTSTAVASTTTEVPGTTTTAEAGSTTTQQAECDDCQPPVAETYCVTFAGLAGDFAAGNGIWQLDRRHPDCYWLYQDEYVTVEVARTGVNRYNVGLTVGPYSGGCSKIWAGPDDNWPCEPAGVYSELNCNDVGCADGDSCEKSVGATCVVAACAPTTAAGTTTSTTGTTTTLPGTTTTTEAPLLPACPSSGYCTGTCAATYSCAGFAGLDCGHAVSCSGTMKWTRSSGCSWPLSQAAGSCSSVPLTCSAGAWAFTVTHGPTGKTCIYQKTAYAESCPGGTYSKTGGTCSDCPSEVTLYV